MSYTSPNYSHKENPHFRYSDGYKPSYSSPNNGQAFSPFNYSTPKLTNRGSRMRYHNNSSPYNYNKSSPHNYKKSSHHNYKKSSHHNYNNSSPHNHNSSSPYNYNSSNRAAYQKNNRSHEGLAPTSAYYNPSMLENPWEELEKEWQEKKELESNTKNAELSDTSTK